MMMMNQNQTTTTPKSSDSCSITIHMTGMGVVRDPRVEAFQVFVLQIHKDEDTCWTIYRRPDSFLILSQQLANSRLLLITRPCPGPGSTPQALLSWLQHLCTLVHVLESPSLQDFLSIEANLPPPGLELMRNHDMAVNSSQSTLRSSSDDDDDDDDDDGSGEMNMEDMFDPHHHHHHHHHHQSSSSSSQLSSSSWEYPEECPEPAPYNHSHQQQQQQQHYHTTPPKPTRPSPSHTSPEKVTLDDFQLLKVIGKGSFGKVLQVRKIDSGCIYAMKVLRKENIIKRNQVEHTRTERQVLGYVHHPFIVSLQFAFQTSDKLYFILDYCAGGELFFHLGKVSRFNVQRARFYIAEITLALEYMHSLDIIYRDLVRHLLNIGDMCVN